MIRLFRQYQNEFQGCAVVVSVLFFFYALLRFSNTTPAVLKEEE